MNEKICIFRLFPVIQSIRIQPLVQIMAWHHTGDNPGCSRSRCSPDLEVNIAPRRRAEILIAVTAGGYWLTHVYSRSGHTICRGAVKQQSHCFQRSHPHLNSIFASKLHTRDPLHWVICIRCIRWHGAHLQAVGIVMEILLTDPEKLPSSLWSRNLRVLPKLMSGHVIAHVGDLNLYHNILCFFAGVSNFIQKQNRTKQKRELNSNMHNGFKQSKKNPHQFNVVLIRLRTWWHQRGILK